MIDNVFNIMQRRVGKLHSQHEIHETFRFGILLAIAGGILDAYTFIGRGGVFSNAQTGNIVLLGIYVAKGQWVQAFLHIPPILAFIIGVIVVQAIKNNSSPLFILDWPRAILIFEIIVLFIIGFVPNTFSDTIVNVIISFVASIQVTSFPKLADSSYSSTMCTGNLRSASKAVYIVFTKKDSEEAIRTIRLFTVVLAFLLGSFLGGLLTYRVGVKAIWGAVIVLICAFVLFSISEGVNTKEKIIE
ncbi:YoaK family protein [Clostridium psychrophilum]|uniref:YoaK family protein n=1 Tax=Clostridium psychrophilum TaxID=132926 RepID=UPI001FE965C3|nr:YoaK family protein [Clostridium psychrophilum]